MKRIIFIFVIFFSSAVDSDEKITTVATVNNITITNTDLEDEMLILKALNNFKEIERSILHQSAFQNLLNQAIKEVELEVNKVEINEDTDENQMTANIKKTLEDNGIKPTRIINKIKKRTQTEKAWKLLISKKYSWKLNINMNEINQKLNTLGYIDQNNPETIKAKNNLIIEEKNKKFNFYSRNHLDLSKKKLLIKIIR